MLRLSESTAPGALLIALESNMAAFWSAYGRGNGSMLQATAEVVWFYTGVPTPLFNGVPHCNLTAGGVKDTRDLLQHLIDERGARALWWIGPRSKPDDVDELLLRHGLQPVGTVPGMAIDLATIRVAPQPIVGLAVEKVNGAEMQRLWAETAGAGSEFSAAATAALARLEATLSDMQYRAQPRYIGYLDGVPVAASALVLHAGVAGIYAVATLPEARGKGIGTMMTALPLLEAKDLGYEVGVLQASAMGFPIYARMGFRKVCTYRLYLQ